MVTDREDLGFLVKVVLGGGGVTASDYTESLILSSLKTISSRRGGVRVPDRSSIVDYRGNGGFKKQDEGFLRATPG